MSIAGEEGGRGRGEGEGEEGCCGPGVGGREGCVWAAWAFV